MTDDHAAPVPWTWFLWVFEKAEDAIGDCVERRNYLTRETLLSEKPSVAIPVVRIYLRASGVKPRLPVLAGQHGPNLHRHAVPFLEQFGELFSLVRRDICKQ